MDIFDGDVEIDLPPDEEDLNPHVRIVGTPEGVEVASAMVRQELEPHLKITMKLDVSWTHHSHIIGKGGNTIKQITSRTGVSIHFPDGNKNSDNRKSNQVSINSRQEELSGLEAARRDIRLLTPLIFNFALPAAAKFIVIRGDPNMLRLDIQTRYNVQVDIAFTNDTTPLLACSIRGSERDASKVKEATFVLLQAFCGDLANHMPVHMHVEISSEHHSFILGRNNETLTRIMQQTSTNITFSENNLTENYVGGPLSRSAITISGAIENVYQARQNIVGCLPLVLMFDLLPDNILDPSEIPQIMQTLSVYILVKTRRQDGRTPIIVKAAERNASNIYEAWKMITKLDKPIPKASIPPNYHLYESQNIDNINIKSLMNGCVTSPIQSPSLTTPHFNFSSANIYSHNSVGSNVDCFSPLYEVPKKDKNLFNNNHIYKDLNTFENEEKVRALVNGFSHLGMKNGDLHKSSSSDGSSSSMLDVIHSATDSPQRNLCNSYSLSLNNGTQDDDTSLLNDQLLLNDRRAPGCERKRLELATQTLCNVNNYSDKRTMAAMAMKQPLNNGVRVPNDNWSGYGFSKSVPSFAFKSQLAEARQQKHILETNDQWNGRHQEQQNLCSSITTDPNNGFGEFQLFNTSNMSNTSNNLESLYQTQPTNKTCNLSASSYIDSVLTTSINKSRINTIPKNLYSLLVELNLEQYSELFIDQCVDLKVFLGLDGEDFKELGIKSFVHRKKLLMAIQSLKYSVMTEASESLTMSSLFPSTDDSCLSGWGDSTKLL